MIYLNEHGVNIFINKYKSKKQFAFWNNYQLIIWQKNYNGYFNIKGLFKNSWGIADKININKTGMWVLPKKYVKYFK